MTMRVSIIAQTDEEIMNFIKESSSFHHKLDNDYVKFYTRLLSNKLIYVKKIYGIQRNYIRRDTELVILLVSLGTSFEDIAKATIHKVYNLMNLPHAACPAYDNTIKRPNVVLYATGLTDKQDQIQKNYKELTSLKAKYKLKKTGIIDLNNCHDVVKELFN